MKIDIENIAIKVTEKVLDDLLYKGKTLREWIDLIIKFEKENKPKEDKRFICDSCRKKYGCGYYGYVKCFIEQNPNNDMKCELYIKE